MEFREGDDADLFSGRRNRSRQGRKIGEELIHHQRPRRLSQAGSGRGLLEQDQGPHRQGIQAER